MRSVVGLVAIGVLAAGLASCETTQESAASAGDTCQEAGYRPGTKRYQECFTKVYSENRRDARSTENAVAAGVAAGVVGGALVAATTPRHYYYGGPYYGRGCWRWGC